MTRHWHVYVFGWCWDVHRQWRDERKGSHQPTFVLCCFLFPKVRQSFTLLILDLCGVNLTLDNTSYQMVQFICLCDLLIASPVKICSGLILWLRVRSYLVLRLKHKNITSWLITKGRFLLQYWGNEIWFYSIALGPQISDFPG